MRIPPVSGRTYVPQNQKSIDNLLKQLSKNENETVSKYIFSEIERLDKEKLRAGDEKIEQVMEELYKSDRKPYLIPRGGRSLQGTAGYCNAMVELKYQLSLLGIAPDHIIVPSATCSTLTGTMLGCKICTMGAQVHGIALSRSPEEGKAMVEEEFNKDAATMGYPFRIKQSEVSIFGDYIGEGYAKITPEAKAAIKLLARTEGILLDPVYTGKAMSGYIDLVNKGFFKTDETVVFIHTGGLPLLFLNEVSQWIGREANNCGN